MMKVYYYRDMLNMMRKAIANKYVNVLARLIMLEQSVYDNDETYYMFSKIDVSNRELVNRIHVGMGSYMTQRLLSYAIAKVAMPEIEWEMYTNDTFKSIIINGRKGDNIYTIYYTHPQYDNKGALVCSVETLIDVDVMMRHERRERDVPSSDDWKLYTIPLYREQQMIENVPKRLRPILEQMLKPGSDIRRLYIEMGVNSPSILMGVLDHRRYSVYNIVIEGMKPSKCRRPFKTDIPIPRGGILFNTDMDFVFQ